MKSQTELNKHVVWTAVVTPLLQDGKIDYASLENLLNKQAEAGNGIVLLGSTAEALNLSSQDKNEIVRFATKLNLKTSMILGIGGHQLDDQLNWMKFGEDHAFDGYLLVTPLYAKPGLVGQTKWFETLMNTSTRPCMLYNVPGRSAVAMHPGVLTNLAGHKNLWSLKEASGSIEKYSQFRQAAPSLTIYSGDDALLPFFVPMGCAGVVSVAGNVWPKETRRYAELSLAQKFEKIFPLWEKASNSLFLASNPLPVKALLHHKGWIKTNVMQAPLHHEDFKDVAKLAAIDTEVAQWMKENA
ncbi:MAG: 4-hydroxy-tetrahydrodipicolinate synthase [Bacteriovoracaceae bacterium]|nr:4-hydroxy-tetrahydrodipicolinate synthase [Bacteriovoracaceae bacterium]